jgi:hypothetical protein
LEKLLFFVIIYSSKLTDHVDLAETALANGLATIIVIEI